MIMHDNPNDPAKSTDSSKKIVLSTEQRVRNLLLAVVQTLFIAAAVYFLDLNSVPLMLYLALGSLLALSSFYSAITGKKRRYTPASTPPPPAWIPKSFIKDPTIVVEKLNRPRALKKAFTIAGLSGLALWGTVSFDRGTSAVLDLVVSSAVAIALFVGVYIAGRKGL